MTFTAQIGSGRPQFIIKDFRAFLAAGAPRLTKETTNASR